eukprot:COSAG02_NODE_11944_length_1626_cov_186.479371_2_plen_64_part_00
MLGETYDYDNKTIRLAIDECINKYLHWFSLDAGFLLGAGFLMGASFVLYSIQYSYYRSSCYRT